MVAPQSARCAGKVCRSATNSIPQSRDGCVEDDWGKDWFIRRNPAKSDHRIFNNYEAEWLSKNEHLAAGCRPNPPPSRGKMPALRRRQASGQSLGNQGPSSFVRLCQTLFYKKNMQAATKNLKETQFAELRPFPMISNRFQSLFEKFMKHQNQNEAQIAGRAVSAHKLAWVGKRGARGATRPTAVVPCDDSTKYESQ
jgi:hypothetical protein